jgi:hypothetical protein
MSASLSNTSEAASAFGIVSLLWSPNDRRPVDLIFNTLSTQQKKAFQVLKRVSDCGKHDDFSLGRIEWFGAAIARSLDGNADDQIVKAMIHFGVWAHWDPSYTATDPMTDVRQALKELFV